MLTLTHPGWGGSINQTKARLLIYNRGVGEGGGVMVLSGVTAEVRGSNRRRLPENGGKTVQAAEDGGVYRPPSVTSRGGLIDL